MARSFPLELWAGIECTRTRVGNRVSDQLDRTGHRHRFDDLDRLASLGVRTVRYPILWEHVVPAVDADPDWTWPDERLERLRELGIRPIAGLLHHGDGPEGTGFDDPRFPERFAAYARSVAERYPWITDWLPINEPLTTARFCGLYGVWQPHARDDRVFARILEVQLRASLLAMDEIRRVIPDARFVQNEDLGTILAVPRLKEQAEYENERRWVTFDVLTGGLRPEMRMWKVLRASGVSEPRLRWFGEHEGGPDLLLVDNYLTSDRLLDDRMHRYPARAHGGNGTQCYADFEAVRAVAGEAPGILPLLRGTWARYGRPLAIGEAHLGGTREEQLRWLRDLWRAAELVRDEGADIRAVTVWSVFGSYDWNTLLTEEKGYYEPGPFDLRAGDPRPTALAEMMRAITSGREPDHPALDADGWWRRDARLLVPPVPVDPVPFRSPRLPSGARATPRRILLSGAEAATIDAFERAGDVRNLSMLALAREHLAIDAAEALDELGAWAVIDAPGCGGARAWRPRAPRTRTGALARACRDAGIPLVLLSCSHATAHPASRCARQQQLREREARTLHDRVLVLRPGTLFGPWDADDSLVRFLASGARAPDTIATPAYLPDVVHMALDLLVDGETGTWDLHHQVRCAWSALEDAAATAARGRDPVLPAQGGSSRPEARVMPLPSLFDALSRFLAESEGLWRRADQPEPHVVELDAGPGMRYPADEPSETLATADDLLSSADGAA